jgi:hypothetical protein
MKPDNAEATDELSVNTHIISPELLASAAWIAFEIRSRSSADIVITSFPKLPRRPMSLRLPRTRLRPKIRRGCSTRLN